MKGQSWALACFFLKIWGKANFEHINKKIATHESAKKNDGYVLIYAIYCDLYKPGWLTYQVFAKKKLKVCTFSRNSPHRWAFRAEILKFANSLTFHLIQTNKYDSESTWDELQAHSGMCYTDRGASAADCEPKMDLKMTFSTLPLPFTFSISSPLCKRSSLEIRYAPIRQKAAAGQLPWRTATQLEGLQHRGYLLHDNLDIREATEHFSRKYSRRSMLCLLKVTHFL